MRFRRISLIISFFQPALTLILSKTPVCDHSEGTPLCHDILTAEHSLLNEETVQLSATLDEAKHTGRVFITLAKSATSLEYDLIYKADAPWRFDEIYLPFWNTKAGDCSTDLARVCETHFPSLLPDGTPLLGSTGRCCECPSLRASSMGIGPSFSRVGMQCNLFDRVVNSDSGQPSAIVVCPKLEGDWHSVYAVGGYRWNFEIVLELLWEDWNNADALFSPQAAAAEFECLENIVAEFDPDIADDLLKQDGELTDLNQNRLEKLQLAAFSARQTCSRQRSAKAHQRRRQLVLSPNKEVIKDEETGLVVRLLHSGPSSGGRLPPALSHKILVLNLEELDAATSGMCGIEGRVNPADLTSLRRLQRQYGSEGGGDYWRALGRTFANMKGGSRSGKKNSEECLRGAFLLPGETVDFYGKECNRIGTSLTTWAMPKMSLFCSQPRGSCLGDQLFTYWERDLMRVAAGQNPQHVLSSHSVPELGAASVPFLKIESQDSDNGHRQTPPQSEEQVVSEKGLAKRKDGGRFRLGWTYPDNHITRISLELPGQSLLWHRAHEDGVIAAFETPGHCDIDSSCVVVFYIRNEGKKTSRFSISVPFCVDTTTNTRSTDLVVAGETGTAVKSSEISPVQIGIRRNAMHGGFYSCKATLEDMQGRALDALLFNLTFTDVDRKYLGTQEGLWAPYTGVFLQDSEGREVSLIRLMGALSLPFRGKMGGFFDMQSGRCGCSLVNVLCLATHFWSCITKARRAALSAMSFAAVLFSVYLCGSPASLCVKIGWASLRSAKRRGKRAQRSTLKNFEKRSGATESHGGITPSCYAAASNGSATPRFLVDL